LGRDRAAGSERVIAKMRRLTAERESAIEENSRFDNSSSISSIDV
jgi:hypothetical protein